MQGRLKKEGRAQYRRKNKKRKYGKNRFHNMSEEKKQNLKEISKNWWCDQKIKIRNFDFFSFHFIKNGTRSFMFPLK